MPVDLRARWVPFDWDNAKLWALDRPVERLPTAELAWMLDLPCWGAPDAAFAVVPRAVMADPEAHPLHRDRLARADLRWPLEVVRNQDRWHVLDGLHRLAKAVLAGAAHVEVRVLPPEWIPRVSRWASRPEPTTCERQV